MKREQTFFQAINEAISLCMETDPSVYIMGLGVPDPKGIFGSTLGLVEKFGARRVMDMPCSENAMTGVVLGSALAGMRPILTHQRIDFAILSMDQIVNQAAKWHYMFGGNMSVPLVIRMIIGRGWGQGPQHSQSLQSWFAHIPGLKVVMPATPHDAKGLLISSIEDNNPVVFIEHRWLYPIKGQVPEKAYREPIGACRVVRSGEDVTLVGISYMTLECLGAAEILEKHGINAEVVDVRTLRPLDEATILTSVEKTGRLVVADTSWATAGFSAEIVARTVEVCMEKLKNPPRRIALPDCPTPTSPSLSASYYPRAIHIAQAALDMFGRTCDREFLDKENKVPHDVPDLLFKGPF